MNHLTPAVLDVFERQHGIATAAALREAGMSPHGLRRLVTDGTLQPILRGTYRLPAVPFTEAARCAAVCGAHPEVAVAGPTAGRLWGLRRLPRDHRIHVLAPPASQPSIAAWVVPYRTAAIRPVDVERRPDGIAITSRARTALDLARHLAPPDLLSVIEQVMHDGRLSDVEMRDVALEWLSPQRPWLRTYLRILDRRLDGLAAESHHETALGDALAAAGLRGLTRQYWIDLPGYGPARFDLAVPRLRWAIEIDVFPTHRETAGRRRDAARDRAAREIHWRVDRVVDEDLGPQQAATVARLQGIARRRRSELQQSR